METALAGDSEARDHRRLRREPRCRGRAETTAPGQPPPASSTTSSRCVLPKTHAGACHRHRGRGPPSTGGTPPRSEAELPRQSRPRSVTFALNKRQRRKCLSSLTSLVDIMESYRTSPRDCGVVRTCSPIGAISGASPSAAASSSWRHEQDRFTVSSHSSTAHSVSHCSQVPCGQVSVPAVGRSDGFHADVMTWTAKGDEEGSISLQLPAPKSTAGAMVRSSRDDAISRPAA